MNLPTEIKRKLFHHLSLLYLVLYVLAPPAFTIYVLLIILLVEGAVEVVRLRRPEVNAYFLAKFGGIHREAEIMRVSGIFWTLLGCWATMVIFTNKTIVMAAIGFLVFGDTAAALVGKKLGRHRWRSSPDKSIEGSVAFTIVSIVWALPIIHWPAAILSSGATAWIETRKLPGNDNFWLPVLGGLFASIFNLFLGGHGGLFRQLPMGSYALYAIVLAFFLFGVASVLPESRG